MEISDQNVWKKCSSCKKPIALGARYYVCSVSTCTSARTGYVFCNVPCFEVHLPSARHKDAAAIEMKAPLRPEPAASEGGRDPVRKIIPSQAANPASLAKSKLPREVLVIASRFKDYIHARAEMNTSGQVMEVLSDYLRVLADRAIDNARSEGRKTVLERDFDFLKK